MRYRRFGRTGLQMPVLTCGGMRYQHKWDDVSWKRSPGESGEPRDDHRTGAGTRHQPHRNRPRLRNSEMQLGPVLPAFRGKTDRADQGGASPIPGVPPELREIDSLPEAGSRGSAVAARHQQPPTCSEWSLRQGGCLDAARQLQQEGRVPLRRLLHPRHHRHHPRRHQQRRIRLRQPALVFRERPELARRARGRAAGHGRVHHQPERQGRETLRAAAEARAPVRAAHADAVQRPLLPARPQVHTLSIGAARPSDFDEHIKALECSIRRKPSCRPSTGGCARR